MSQPIYRYLRGYTIDPGFSTQLDTMGINEMIYRIKWEYLEPGPIGQYVEVIDYDPTSNYCYDPVDLDSIDVLAQNGLAPNEGNATFHQQFVYLIIMQTIGHFEKALGRSILWRRKKERKGNKIVRAEQYIKRLRVYPHALRDANAFYSDEKLALLFGYFDAGSRIQGANFPGGVVFTCLSPDIIAHETTHAILDSMLPKYLENTNPDVPAFHEAFSDIVALLQRFGNTQLVEHQIAKTRGRLDEYSILGELATQFGQALESGRGALRSAIGRFDEAGKWQKMTPDPTAYQQVFEPHKRGAILVAAVFDAFMRLYNFKTQDLLRIATQGTGVLPQGSIHPDLVKRLANEASAIALHLLSVCIRALDYCPPFDITFGDYLRAVITADSDFCPADENWYRVSLIDSFRAWGIFPQRVNTLSVYSLKWEDPGFDKKQEQALAFLVDFIRQDIHELSQIDDRDDLLENYPRLQKKLEGFLNNPVAQALLWRSHMMATNVWDHFMDKMGIAVKGFSLAYEEEGNQHSKTLVELVPDGDIEVHSFWPTFRLGSMGQELEQVIINFTRTMRGKKKSAFEQLRFSGGATLIFRVAGKTLKADYAIVKRARSTKRLSTQLTYQSQRSLAGCLTDSMFEDDNGFNISIEKLHFH